MGKKIIRKVEKKHQLPEAKNIVKFLKVSTLFGYRKRS